MYHLVHTWLYIFGNPVNEASTRLPKSFYCSASLIRYNRGDNQDSLLSMTSCSNQAVFKKMKETGDMGVDANYYMRDSNKGRISSKIAVKSIYEGGERR